MARGRWLLLTAALAVAVPLAAQVPRPETATPARGAAAPRTVPTGLPAARPEEVGLSSERLARMHAALAERVDQGEVAGLVSLVARHGRIADIWAYGKQDLDNGVAMQPDTIVRIASMTKPITSVAVMMLYEEGRLLLTDPLSKFAPGFKEARVLSRAPGGEAWSEAKADREINLRDLLTHRAGITYGFIDSGPVGDAYRKAGVSDGLAKPEGTMAENVARLAAQPLVSQPGREYRYGLSIDVLGHVVEVVSGLPLDRFFQERILGPLRMVDTGFTVPESKWARLATVYSPREGGGIRPMKDPESFGNVLMSPVAHYREPSRYFSGGAGLVSTARDYARFMQMMLNGGELDGVRLLGPKTVELILASHTSDLPRGTVGDGLDFGLGFSVVTDLGATRRSGSPGLFGWGGIYATTAWADPKEKLVGILMAQRYPSPGVRLGERFQALAYQAVVRPAAGQ